MISVIRAYCYTFCFTYQHLCCYCYYCDLQGTLQRIIINRNTSDLLKLMDSLNYKSLTTEEVYHCFGETVKL